MFLLPLANLSVIQSMVVGIQIVASQLTCLMPHCSGHFLHTYCSVSHFFYSQKFYFVPSLQQGFNFFYDKNNVPHSFPSIIHSVHLIISITLKNFFFFFFFFLGGGGAQHTLQYLSKIKVLARHVVCDECNVLFPPKCVIFM